MENWSPLDCAARGDDAGEPGFGDCADVCGADSGTPQERSDCDEFGDGDEPLSGDDAGGPGFAGATGDDWKSGE